MLEADCSSAAHRYGMGEVRPLSAAQLEHFHFGWMMSLRRAMSLRWVMSLRWELSLLSRMSLRLMAL